MPAYTLLSDFAEINKQRLKKKCPCPDEKDEL